MSGTWAVGGVFALLGLDVAREGTLLVVQGLPVSVEASCAGLNVLQAMLIAGSLAADVHIAKREHYWWHLPALVALAWIANTVRILAICTTALSAGPEVAMGWFHFFGGWVVLCGMFFLCWITFSLVGQPKSAASRAI